MEKANNENVTEKFDSVKDPSSGTKRKVIVSKEEIQSLIDSIKVEIPKLEEYYEDIKLYNSKHNGKLFGSIKKSILTSDWKNKFFDKRNNLWLTIVEYFEEKFASKKKHDFSLDALFIKEEKAKMSKLIKDNLSSSEPNYDFFDPCLTDQGCHIRTFAFLVLMKDFKIEEYARLEELFLKVKIAFNNTVTITSNGLLLMNGNKHIVDETFPYFKGSHKQIHRCMKSIRKDIANYSIEIIRSYIKNYKTDDEFTKYIISIFDTQLWYDHAREFNILPAYYSNILFFLTFPKDEIFCLLTRSYKVDADSYLTLKAAFPIYYTKIDGKFVEIKDVPNNKMVYVCEINNYWDEDKLSILGQDDIEKRKLSLFDIISMIFVRHEQYPSNDIKATYESVKDGEDIITSEFRKYKELCEKFNVEEIPTFERFNDNKYQIANKPNLLKANHVFCSSAKSISANIEKMTSEISPQASLFELDHPYDVHHDFH